jgi:hypothetical protein
MKLLSCPPRRPIGAAALTLGLALALAPAAASAATASPQAPAAKAPAPHLVGCNESGPVRPTRFNPICDDGAYTVVDLHWSAGPTPPPRERASSTRTPASPPARRER